mmetsp:Transcript_23178/g.64434  ORF Transcript_23178/g.64434 Transcript_23178/m.64434 type:complete len:227 (-) Transcript_23178:2294-2974(-)
MKFGRSIHYCLQFFLGRVGGAFRGRTAFLKYSWIFSGIIEVLGHMSFLILERSIGAIRQQVIHQCSVIRQCFFNERTRASIVLPSGGRGIFFVLQVLRISLHQGFHLGLAIVGEHERRMTISVLVVHIGTGHHQTTNNGQMAPCCGGHQGCGAILIMDTDRSSSFEQCRYDFVMSFGRCGNQGRNAFFAGIVQVRSALRLVAIAFVRFNQFADDSQQSAVTGLQER